jgi:quercetin dioxygenase-like cupin family protein
MSDTSEVFSTIAETPPQRIWGGVIARARYGAELTLAVVELDPNSAIPEHSHPNEQVGLLIEGSATFRVGSVARSLSPGASWCIPAHAPHEVHVGAEGAVIVEAFAPPRDDWRALDETPPTPPHWPP